MQKAEPQHNQTQNQHAQRQSGSAVLESPQCEQIAQLEAMANASSQAGRLAQLAAMANNSPCMAAQRKAISAIHNSPNVTAQRQQIDSLAGDIAQREETEEPLQPKVAQREAAPAKPNNTGLPDNLKNGIESLSGMSMDSVRVHYNSSQPAQLNALAYAQGTDIHVGPGQEQHLPHEAWHVVQQAQGRVRPTMQMKDGVPVNDDQGLEHEADVMGAKAALVGVAERKSIESDSIDSKKYHECHAAQLAVDENGFSAEQEELFDLVDELKKNKSKATYISENEVEESILRMEQLARSNDKSAISKGLSVLKQEIERAKEPNKSESLDKTAQFSGWRFAGAFVSGIVGAIVGAVIGGALGSTSGPAGTVIGAVSGGIAGLTGGGIAGWKVGERKDNLNRTIAAYTPDLDILLGAGNDPGGIRRQLMVNTPVLATFNAAVLAIVAAVPLARRVNLLNQLGNDAVLLQGLLTDCTAPTDAGTSAFRLERVLVANPGVITRAALAPFIAAQIRIDEKILRGEITGGAPAVGAVPTAANRNLIGGHSQAITADPTYVIDNTVNNMPNTPTHYVSFRKLVRTDVNGFAADVNAGAPGNILATINPLLAIATGVGAAPPAFNVGPPLHVINQWTLGRAPHIANTNAAAGLAAAAALLVVPAAAGAVAAGAGNAAGMAPFIDAIVDLYTHTRNALTAAIAVQNHTAANTATAARVQLDAAILAWQQNGPVLSANKNSTFAPPGWNDDDVIRAGDLTAAVQAALVRYNNPPPVLVPPNGANVESKHQLVIADPATGQNFVWVVIKDNATYNVGPPPSITGGNIISSYPTNDVAIPAPPVAGAMDADRFSPI